MRSFTALLALYCFAHAIPATAEIVPSDQTSRTIIKDVVKCVAVTEVIRVRYESAANIDQSLRVQGPGKGSGPGGTSTLPVGIDSIVADARTNSLVITGTAEGVAAVKKTIAALDVQPRFVTIQFSILRFDFDAEGDWDVRVVSRPTTKTLDNSPAAISASGDGDAYTAEITPHINADGTIGLEGGLRATGQHSTFKRRIAAHTKAILTGVTASLSTSIRKTAAAGRIPFATGEPFTVYYLQLVSVQEDTPIR